jgi:hypothetical protein
VYHSLQIKKLFSAFFCKKETVFRLSFVKKKLFFGFSCLFSFLKNKLKNGYLSETWLVPLYGQRCKVGQTTNGNTPTPPPPPTSM